MSAQDKLPAQTYISSPHNYQSSFVKHGGYALPPTQSNQSLRPVAVPIPILEARQSFAPVTKKNRMNRKINRV